MSCVSAFVIATLIQGNLLAGTDCCKRNISEVRVQPYLQAASIAATQLWNSTSPRGQRIAQHGTQHSTTLPLKQHIFKDACVRVCTSAFSSTSSFMTKKQYSLDNYIFQFYAMEQLWQARFTRLIQENIVASLALATSQNENIYYASWEYPRVDGKDNF